MICMLTHANKWHDVNPILAAVVTEIKHYVDIVKKSAKGVVAGEERVNMRGHDLAHDSDF